MAIDYLTAKVHLRTLPRLCPDQPLTFRRDVVGTIFTAPVLCDDGGDSIKVLIPGDKYPTYVHFTQVVSVGDVPAPAPEMPSESAIEAPPARLEASKPFVLAIRPIDPAIAKSRYEALAVDRVNGTGLRPVSPCPTLKHVGLFDALAIAALVEIGTGEYTVSRDISDSLHDAISAAMDAGQLAYKQDIIGELPTGPGRGVNLARGQRYYAWAAQS